MRPPLFCRFQSFGCSVQRVGIICEHGLLVGNGAQWGPIQVSERKGNSTPPKTQQNTTQVSSKLWENPVISAFLLH